MNGIPIDRSCKKDQHKKTMTSIDSTPLMQAKAFAAEWKGSSQARQAYGQLLKAVEDICAAAADQGNRIVEFVARPGVSMSLRLVKPGAERPVAALVDVIDDDPEDRWLSVCFNADRITDPQTLGEPIPGGLQGGDGYCFDVGEDEGAEGAYLAERLAEAWRNANAEE